MSLESLPAPSLTWNVRSIFLALIYISTLLTGVFSRSQGKQPLDLNHLPRFVSSSNNYSYRVGEVAVLRCTVENLGRKQKVVWRQASDPTPLTVGVMSFSEDPRLSVVREDNSWNLLIRDVQIRDAGVYECQISSTMRHLRQHVTLMVTEPLSPSTTEKSKYKPNIQISGSTFLDVGDRLRLVCNATIKDYPPEDIDWFRAGDTLFTDDERGLYIQKHVSLSTGTIHSTLEIRKVKISDAGVYVCRTSNKDVIDTRVNVLKTRNKQTKRGDGMGVSERSTTDDDNAGRSWHSCLHLVLFSSLISLLLTGHIFSSLDLT